MTDKFSDETLQNLESRLSVLEAKIVGHANPNEFDGDIISSLADFGSKLGNALSTRDRTMMVMKRLDELERYLDPEYSEPTTLTDNMKADLIIAREDTLRQRYEQLQSVQKLKSCLDSQHISDTPSLEAPLTESWTKLHQLEDKTRDQSLHTKNLFENYNAMISTITEAFIKMDDLLTKAELEALPKKTID